MDSRTVLLTTSGLRALQSHLLTKVESQIFWHLVATMDLGGEVVAKKTLADDLSLLEKQTNTAIKRFQQIGFLLQGPKMGRSFHYKLNPAFFRILSL